MHGYVLLPTRHTENSRYLIRNIDPIIKQPFTNSTGGIHMKRNALMLSSALIAALLFLGCPNSNTPEPEPEPEPEPTYPALLLAGTSATAYGSTGIATQFTLSPVVDFTGEDYTITMDYFIPSTAGEVSMIQFQLPNSSYSPCYLDVGSLVTDAWTSITETVTAADVSYGELRADSNAFRIYAITGAAGTGLEMYLKAIKISNGTDTPIDIVVTADSNYTGNYAPLGENVTFTTTTK
jgi:hypothetical protein